jgi:hypothetical protein
MEPKVMIIIPTEEMGRRADFYDYMDMMHRPDGTVTIRPHGQSPARNRNLGIEEALKHECTHCFFVDDDVILRPDALLRLLAHDKDLVGGLYLMRNYPHLPILFDESYDDGRCLFSFLKPGRKGLVETVNTGLGCMLIKTDVFRKMERPWVRIGQLEKDHWCDDIEFFNRARNEYSYQVYVDLEVQAGHIISTIIFPHRDDKENWHTAYATNINEAFTLPQQSPSDEDLRKQLESLGAQLISKV